MIFFFFLVGVSFIIIPYPCHYLQVSTMPGKIIIHFVDVHKYSQAISGKTSELFYQGRGIPGIYKSLLQVIFEIFFKPPVLFIALRHPLYWCAYKSADGNSAIKTYFWFHSFFIQFLVVQRSHSHRVFLIRSVLMQSVLRQFYR